MLYRTLKSPLGLQLELTTRCTNCCLHCYNYQRQEKTDDISLDIEKVSLLFDKIEKAEIPIVTLTGGEPLLESEVLLKCIKECSDRGIHCSINTNLVPLNEKLLLDMINTGEFSILTSLASYQPKVHDFLMNRAGVFDKTTEGMRLIRKANINFSVNMVVTKINADQVYKTGLLAHELGAGKFAATKANPPLGCKDYSQVQPTHEQVRASLDALLALQKDIGIKVDALECYPLCFFGDLEKYEIFTKRNCSAGVTSGAIGPEGGLRPCSHSNTIYGNVFENNIEEIFAKMTEWRSGELLPEKCKSCSYLSRCSGGCRCEADYCGDIKGMDPYAYGGEAIFSEGDIGIKLLDHDQFVYFHNDIQFRSENFGYIIYRNGNIAIIDNDAKLVLSDCLGKEISIKQISEKFSFDINEVTKLITILVNKKLVKCSF